MPSFPILEFDPTRPAQIEPGAIIQPIDTPEHCVVCFFQDVIDRLVLEHAARPLSHREWEGMSHPLYELEHLGQRLAVFHPGVGAPLAAGMLEEVIALGCKKFIACGGCGVIEAGIEVGKFLVPYSALRDEGTSYHYLKPSREVAAGPQALAAIEKTLQRNQQDYRLVKTWTTDAPYRETLEKVRLRRAEGCQTVEMEAAAFFAVAQFRGVPFGQILYAGDDVSGEQWASRSWHTRRDVRLGLFWLAAEACLEL
jgi:uridine phosphorylase